VGIGAGDKYPSLQQKTLFRPASQVKDGAFLFGLAGKQRAQSKKTDVDGWDSIRLFNSVK
jgi:hypothetical protein